MISRQPTAAMIATLRAVAVVFLVVLSSAAARSAEGQERQQPAEVSELSEASLTERIAAAYDLMQKEGSFEDGYAKLRSALADAARTDLYAFTVTSYSNAGATMYENQILDRAEEILAEGMNTQAMKEDVKERADFYLNYACLLYTSDAADE